MPRNPLQQPKITPHGAYGYIRKDETEGSCAAGGYPCTHLGVDLAGDEGEEVVAPDTGHIVALGYGDVRPFRGYGPGVVLIETPAKAGNEFPSANWWTTRLLDARVADKPKYWHLLAHLSGSDLKERWGGQSLTIGAKRIPIKEGEVVGRISQVRHVHWEVRTQPLGDGAKVRTSPSLWLGRWGGVGTAADLMTADVDVERKKTGGWILWAAILMMRERRR